MGQDGYRLHDKRHICVNCYSTAVFDNEKAGELYNRVLNTLDHDLNLQLSVVPMLNVVDRDEMLAHLQGVENDEPNNQTDLVFGLFVRHGRKRTIYIESGLPQILMIQVIAHELAHAWQGENCPLLRDPLWREGFAEWIAYRVLLVLGAVKKAAFMLQRVDLYGQGLQAVFEVERRGGVNAVYEACQRNLERYLVVEGQDVRRTYP